MHEEALEHFKDVCLREFQFLVDDYGYTPAPLPGDEFANPFQFRLSNGTITLVVEGINYGMNIMDSLEDRCGRCVGIECLRPDWEPFPKKKRPRKQAISKSQDEQIALAAQHLKEYGQDVLLGNLERFNTIGDRLNEIERRLSANKGGQ